MNRKNIFIIVLMLICFVFVGCTEFESSVDEKQEKATEALMAEAERQIGMPNIKNWTMRKQAKMILEMQDQADLITYAYYLNQFNGKLVFLGRAIGFGLPYSVQYTNPEKYHYNGTTLPQPDPNGLFMPTGLSATWILLINEETGEPQPVYSEPNIFISPFKLNKRLCDAFSLPEDY